MISLRIPIALCPAATALLICLIVSCDRPRHTSISEGGAAASADADTEKIVLRKFPLDKQFAGFLSDYSSLKPSSELQNALTYVKLDEQKNLHKYIGMIVDPVQVYVASNVDESKLPEKGRGVAARYFHRALEKAVSSAFPILDRPGPLVLRLRSAIIGVDVGGAIPAADKSEDPDALDRTINIGKVAVEMELVDSETGEQIAAMVDRENLGAGAEIGSATFSKQQKWAAAYEAFDGWAHRVRNFLDTAHELSGGDAQRADEFYRPYSEEPLSR